MSKKPDWISLAVSVIFCVLVLESFTALYLFKLRNIYRAEKYATTTSNKCCLNGLTEKLEKKIESRGFCNSVHLCFPDRIKRDAEENGLPGLAGRPGPKGDMGLDGLQGRPGYFGEKGDHGYRGERGDDGMPGLFGVKGVEGNPGALGKCNNFGKRGPPGRPGLPATSAPKGDRGPWGYSGMKGEPGDVGFKGGKGHMPPIELGAMGPKGVKGFRGDVGSEGQKGELGWTYRGQRGEVGDVKMECADVGGSNPTANYGITCVKGSKGESGDVPGLWGPPGPPGQWGDKGERGYPGVVGIDGPDGLNGLWGPPGAKGETGTDGENCTCDQDSPVNWRATLLKSYPSLPPRYKRVCNLFTVEYTKILLVEEADEYTVMVDSSPLTKEDKVKFWATNRTGEFRMFKDIKNLRKSQWWKLGADQDLDEPVQGCGNVIHAGWFFYHAKDKVTIVKQPLKAKKGNELDIPISDIKSVKTGSVVQYLELPVKVTIPLYVSQTIHVDLHFDNHGLWAIFAEADTPYLNVAKIDPDKMKIEHLWSLNIKHDRYAGMLIYDGILFVVETLEDKSNVISHGFDFFGNKPLEVNVIIPLILEPVTRISYNQYKKELLVGVSDWLYTYEVECLDVQAN